MCTNARDNNLGWNEELLKTTKETRQTSTMETQLSPLFSKFHIQLTKNVCSYSWNLNKKFVRVPEQLAYVFDVKISV